MVLSADNRTGHLRWPNSACARWPFRPNAARDMPGGGHDRRNSTAELSSRTLEAKGARPFMIGEAVDVTAVLGGYNCQWAWASGVAAGDVI